MNQVHPFIYGSYVQNMYQMYTTIWLMNKLDGKYQTPDISHMLQFKWFQPVLYHDPQNKYPDTNESPGYFVGFAECVGDALTFKILKEDMRTLIDRSMVQPAEDKKDMNRRAKQKDKVQLNPEED